MGFHPFVPAEIEAALGQRYVVGPEIAIGGQGAVFKATRVSRPDDTPAGDVVALKLHLYPGKAIRVQREITAMESLSHPNLGRLIEHGYCDMSGRHTGYIASEFIEGQSLKHRLRIGGRLLESEVLPIARDVLAAVTALWSQRIVHGDIKPSNIMLRDSGSAVLIDLGVASFFEEDAAPRPLTPVSPERFAHGGTLGYMSPEQARGQRPLTCASDIFSLGVVMVESVQGWHPTSGDQSALLEGIRASGGKLTVSTGLLKTLDKMLLKHPPESRGKLAELSAHFEALQEIMEQQFARGARAPQNAQG
jgi:serine/threonine protein kinase